MAQWILYACVSALMAGLTPVFLKSGARRAAPALAAAVFALLTTLAYGAAVLLSGVLPSAAALSGRTLALTALAGLVHALSLLCLVRALSAGPVSKVAPITNFSGILVTIVSMLLFEGWLGLWKWVFILVALLGTVLMEASGQSLHASAWLPFALLAAVFGAAAEALTGIFLPELPEAFLRFALSGVSFICLAAIAVIGRSLPSAARMPFESWVFLVLSALAAGMSALTKLYSAALGEWSLLRPVVCLTIVTTLVFSRICHRERLSAANILGLVLTVLGMFALLMDF